MFPFILIGNLIAKIKPLKSDYDIYFFFPGFSIGGAERVNAEIIKAFEDKKVIIFFTKNSPNSGMKHFFELPNVTLKEINRWTDNKLIYWANLIYRGICAGYINSNVSNPIVFIGQCNFGYKLTPHIRRGVKIHELIHMYDPKFVWVWAPFIKFISTRIVVGDIFLKKFEECYRRNGIPLKYLERLKVIFYRLEYMPASFHKRNFELPLKVYYAGRGGPQKRVWIILNVVKRAKELKLPVEFKLAGSFKNELPEQFLKDEIYVGELQGGEAMYNFHRSNDVLLMTSAWEGFPLVIMEAMAFGSIPLVTSIDAIPEHIVHKVNGFLLQNVDNEEKLVDEIVSLLNEMSMNTSNLKSISYSAYSYASINFSGEKFQSEYRNVLLGS